MPLLPEEEARDIILHEIAHALVFQCAEDHYGKDDLSALARIHRRLEFERGRASAKSAFLQGKMVVTTPTTSPTERHYFDARILP